MQNKKVNSDKLKIRSTHENLRLCVIENSIFIEEFISDLLGTILNINWETSKSFGFGSTSLSFNLKVQLIQDIKSVSKEEIQKLTCLMNIRNKFAHTNVATFEDLFSKTSVGKQIKKEFLKWYFDSKGIDDIHPSMHELVYRLCFYLLVDSIVDTLMKILGDHMYELGKLEVGKEFNEKLMHELVEFLKSIEGGKDLVNNLIDKVNMTVSNRR